MTDLTLPSDYDQSDGFDEDRALDKCPHCGATWAANGGMIGPTYDSNGQRHETYFETDPGNGPFFCADCWDELQTNRKQSENQTLGDFA